MNRLGELSPSDYEIAAELRAAQPFYEFQPTKGTDELGHKTLVGMIGPTGIGKSYLSDKIIEIAPEFRYNGTTTTRQRRPNDPANFKTAREGITHEWMRKAVNQKRLVNFSVFDTGHIYGTAPEDISEYSIGPILSDSIDGLMTAGLKDFYPVFVIARGAIYQQRLEQERLDLPDIRQRLAEAAHSIMFAELNVDAPWLTCVDTGNSLEELAQAADEVVRTVYQRTRPIMTTGHKLLLLTEMKNAIQNVKDQLV